jgi:hypothetical protein
MGRYRLTTGSFVCGDALSAADDKEKGPIFVPPADAGKPRNKRLD